MRRKHGEVKEDSAWPGAFGLVGEIEMLFCQDQINLQHRHLDVLVRTLAYINGQNPTQM